jgi:hypothetical protein
MKFFETVNRVLNVQVPALAADLGMPVPDLYNRMGTLLPTMTDEWKKGSAPLIPYADPVCRMAYMFCHVAINANLFHRALVSSFIDPVTSQQTSLGQVVRARIETSGRLRVCAFGGGPGTELLALSKYLVLHPLTRPHADLELVLLDRVQEWAESWESLKEAIYEQFAPGAPRPFSISSSVLSFDMTNIGNYGTVSRLLSRDLFVLNYVISEVFDPALLQALTNVVSKMRAKSPGAQFLFLDRNDDRTLRAVDGILSQGGLTKTYSATVGGWMDADERKLALAEHAMAIGRQPRVQWQLWRNGPPAAFFTIAR